MSPTRVLLALGLILACAASSHAQTFGGTKVVETGVAYPGIGTFNSFVIPPDVIRPSISGTVVSFGGTLSTGAPELARAGVTGMDAIATTSIAIPGGGGNFLTFAPLPLGLSGGVYTFRGKGSSPTTDGIYSNASGSLAAVVSIGMANPTGGTFTNIAGGAVSGTTVTFIGTSVPNGPPTAVYTRTGGGSILPIVTTSSTMPGGAGNFANFADPSGNTYTPNISGPNVVFGGRNASGSSFGLFMTNGFGVTAVATNATAIPNGTDNFTALSPVPAISGSNVAFQAFGANGQQGVYRSVGGVLSRVADRNTPVPGAPGTTFDSFLFMDVAISGDRVAFRGHGTGGTDGIYTDLTGTLMKVIAVGDTLDGKTVSVMDISQFAFDGNRIAVVAGFTNGSTGVYTFTPVPEPTGLLAIGVAGLLAATIRKRR